MCVHSLIKGNVVSFLLSVFSQDQTKEPRGKFDLIKGCIIGNIAEVDAPTKKLKRHGEKVSTARMFLIT